MESIKKAWNGEENLALVFWGYFALGQLGMATLLGAMLGFTAVQGFPYVWIAFAIFVVLPYCVWVYKSLWSCAFNVMWKPWGYIARIIAIALIVEWLLRQIGKAYN